MHIDLHQWRLADALEAVNLAGLDDKDVTRSRFEFLTVHFPRPAPFAHELNLVVRMAVLYDLLTSGPVAVEAAVEVA